MISGLKETSIKRYVVERTNRAWLKETSIRRYAVERTNKAVSYSFESSRRQRISHG